MDFLATRRASTTSSKPPAKDEHWTADDVEEGRPLLRVGRGARDAPLIAPRAKVLACCVATFIFLMPKIAVGGSGRRRHVESTPGCQGSLARRPFGPSSGAAPTSAPTPGQTRGADAGRRRDEVSRPVTPCRRL